MTSKRQFSRRYGLRPRSPSFVYDNVSPALRQEFLLLIEPYFDNDFTVYNVPWQDLARSLRRKLALSTRTELIRQPDEGWHAVQEIVDKCNWFEFYDVCEEFHRYLGSVGFAGEEFENELNGLLTEAGVGYQMRDGEVERIGSAFVDEQVAEARQLLANPKFRGPDEQFEKAIRFLSQRPEPDNENCVKEAVGAMEAVARILANDEKALFPEIIDREPFKSAVHGALREVMKRVYGYRGDVGGVAHGQVGPSKVGVEEAELVLGVCASAIVYLVNKFGKQPP